VAVTVMGAQEMENRGVAGFAELLSSIPNVAIDQSSSAQPNISIRGISSSTNNIGIESGVGVVVDDVFLGRPSAFSTQLIDVERVEVLRGSQGTLFGKNTIGGLINIVTSLPSRTFGGAADITVGNFGLKQARGYVPARWVMA
jgi:iron complex outermembrane receptor protein